MMLSVRVNNLKETIAKYQDYQANLISKVDLFLQELAEIGKGRAELGFYGADYRAGVNDSNVFVEQENGIYRIVASGNAVIFIEFGTGDDAKHPLGAEHGYISDAWSSTHRAQQYHRFGTWQWNGETFTGTPANKGMYEAGKEMRNRLEEVARRIFR